MQPTDPTGAIDQSQHTERNVRLATPPLNTVLRSTISSVGRRPVRTSNQSRNEPHAPLNPFRGMQLPEIRHNPRSIKSSGGWGTLILTPRSHLSHRRRPPNQSKVWMVHSCPFQQDELTGQDQKSKWMGYRYSNPHDPTGANHQDEVTGQGIKPDPTGEDEALKDAKPK